MIWTLLRYCSITFLSWLKMLHLLDILSADSALILGWSEIALIKTRECSLVLAKSINSRCLFLIGSIACSVGLPELELIVSICSKSSSCWFNSHRSFLYFGFTYWGNRVFSCWMSIVFGHLYRVRCYPLFNLLGFLLIYASNRVAMTTWFLWILFHSTLNFVWDKRSNYSSLIWHLRTTILLQSVITLLYHRWFCLVNRFAPVTLYSLDSWGWQILLLLLLLL